MSRIGRKPIAIPAGVTVTVGEGNVVTVKGPKGELTQTMHGDMIIKVEASEVIVERPSEQKLHKSLHGLTRTLVANMVTGVSTGFSKELEINGVGYRAQKQGNKLVLSLGYSHPVEMEDIPGLTVEVPAPNKIVVSGADKQAVGQLAAKIREKRPPEPYKGKGIKYVDERIIRKEGKVGKAKK
ncbi:MAG: 50S ribosomal protein L6 [Clostridia bacterium]